MPPTLNGKALKLGFDEQCPFVLKEESKVDFERLLSVLYPRFVATSIAADAANTSLSSKSPLCRAREADEWISILRLARKYDIEDIIPLATGHLDSLPLDPFRKILIWEEYRLEPSLLLSSYVQLCQRTEPLTLIMAKMLGLETFTKIAAARDLYHQRVGCDSCKKWGRARKQALAQEIVSRVFFT